MLFRSRGNINILNGENIAIIGCRKASEYGAKAARYFAYNLAKKGKNIVSGLAKGIDSYAHIGNLAAILENECTKEKENKNTINYGKPIAVVGSGLDIIYPKENEILQRKILDCGGAIISEYPLGTKPNRMNFPARNRIISGISKGVLVIDRKSVV